MSVAFKPEGSTQKKSPPVPFICLTPSLETQLRHIKIISPEDTTKRKKGA
ncbi:hypothetical protein EJ73_00990 [Hoylesella shahii DSM 15611 = JCM 12083]|uniref:Uncharacterized protein n=1 Tax=Hoylesella shahii DSM 15611 = JCM 12083 TaxID=1122991 RepID=A0A318HX45_9BACT|nr:hypothetical protein EJ73_00990 [Hoylesella shahii DSM 15611 = JCM 12083]